MIESRLLAAQDIARCKITGILRHNFGAIEDVIQEASLRAWKFRHTFREECEFSTWFVRIAINTALMYLRRRQVSKPDLPLEADYLPSTYVSPYQLFMKNERKRKLFSAIAKLTPVLRRTALNVLLEKPAPGNTEKSNRFRLRRELRKLLSY